MKTQRVQWHGGYVTDHVLGLKWEPEQWQDIPVDDVPKYTTHTGFTVIPEGAPNVKGTPEREE